MAFSGFSTKVNSQFEFVLFYKSYNETFPRNFKTAEKNQNF